ncbi:hypothetical protein Tco_0155828 [Tanacetum coccineum]
MPVVVHLDGPWPVPAQCESSNQRIETENASLRRAFRQNGQRPLTIGFDYGGDLVGYEEHCKIRVRPEPGAHVLSISSVISRGGRRWEPVYEAKRSRAELLRKQTAVRRFSVNFALIEDEVHTTTNDETEDTLVPKSSSLIKKAEAEAALLKAQPSFPNVGQLNELLVKSLQTEFSKILFAHDFSSSLPTELKDLPSKFNELTEEVKGLKKQVHELEIKLPGDLKEIPTKLVASVQAKLKTLDALSGLLLNVTKALNKFAQVLDSASSKAGDQSVPSAGQADTMPAEEEAEKESTNSDSNDDDETHVTGSVVEPSTIKKLKKFDFITEDGRHVHLIEEEINHQKNLEEDAKVEAAKQEGELRKA